MTFLEQTLAVLDNLTREGRFEELESDGLEIKPVPSTGGDWNKIRESVNAFLNTRGGIVILGVKESGTGPKRRYELTGWRDEAEPSLKQITTCFTDDSDRPIDVSENVRFELKPLANVRVMVVHIDELAADKKFVFQNRVARKRVITGDHLITDKEIRAQQEFKEESIHARELQPMPDLTLADLDLSKLNRFIYQLNLPVPIETIKTDLESARPFLERRAFLKGGVPTLLGALVCAKHPGDALGFRCHVHSYIDTPQLDDDGRVVRDRQDFVDNVLALMEHTYGYLLRNIQVGVVAEGAGSRSPQYPANVLRETVNNALAHRDYQLNRQVIVSVQPGRAISIQNPGRFPARLLIEADGNEPAATLRRIIPEAKPRNPKLADVLRVHNKWEGRGIGMATLVNYCLDNRIDVPYYRVLTEEVELTVPSGAVFDARMTRLFESFGGYIRKKLQGNNLTPAQAAVLAYVIKSQWANEKLRYTILLTPDNNHMDVLEKLSRAALVSTHPAGTPNYPIYVADPVFTQSDHTTELRAIFGAELDELSPLHKRLLDVAYRYSKFSIERSISAKQASYTLWYEDQPSGDGIELFDRFYRKVRAAFNHLQKQGFLARRPGKSISYVVNEVRS